MRIRGALDVRIDSHRGPSPALAPLLNADRLRILEPPYRTLSSYCRQKRVGSGAAWVILVDNLDSRETASVSEYARMLRRLSPSRPISVVVKSRVVTTTSFREGSKAALMALRADPRIRGVFAKGFTETDYRRALAYRSFGRLFTWLSDLYPGASLRQRGALSIAASLVADSGDDDLTYDGTKLTRQLRSLGLPTAHRWLMLARAFPSITLLQVNQCSVEDAAAQGGYKYPRVYRRHCRQLLNQAPSTLRIWSGWEPILYRFISNSSEIRGAKYNY